MTHSAQCLQIIHLMINLFIHAVILSVYEVVSSILVVCNYYYHCSHFCNDDFNIDHGDDGSDSNISVLCPECPWLWPVERTSSFHD